MKALGKIGTISEQLKSILERLNKLDIIENHQESCIFNYENSKERRDRMDEHDTTINSLLASERKVHRDQMNEPMSKNFYLKAYSRRENIKFFSIPEEEKEDIEKTLRTDFMADDLGYRNARTVEIHRAAATLAHGPLQQ